MKDDLYPQKIHILILGFCAVSAQAVFLRELLGLFTGTEFTLGFLLFSWLFWIGTGGLVGGGLSNRAKDKKRLARIISVLAGALLPLTVIAIRSSRGMLQDAIAEFPGYFKALLSAFLIIGPFTFLYGMIYNTASALFRKRSGGIRESITDVYRFEAAGSIAGGLVFSFILLRFFTQLESAFIIFLSVLATSITTFRPGWKPFAVLASCAAAFVALLPCMAKIDSVSYQRIFPKYELKGFFSSKYAELIAVSREGMLSVYAGGSRVISIPEPEMAEEIVHIPLLSHDEPVDLLIIGSGFESIVEESAKHRTVGTIDLMNLDQGISDLIEKVIESNSGEWDARVGSIRKDIDLRKIYGDPRTLLASSENRYDLIVISVPEPVNIQWNRFYTTEFFKIVKNALAEGGVAAISHRSSENYISANQAEVLNILENTLREIFDDVVALPGSRVHFICGRDCGGLPARIFVNIEERELDTSYINAAFLSARFSSERVEHLRTSLDSHLLGDINTDLYPRLPYRELMLEAERKRSSMEGLLRAVSALPGYFFPAAVLIILFLSMILARRRSIDRTAVFITGFCSFLFQLSVMTLYQVFSGILYYGLIMISAFFMAGLSLGSSSPHPRSERSGVVVRYLHAGFFSTVSVLFLLALGDYGQSLMKAAGKPIMYFLSFLNGFLTGSYYRAIVSSSYILKRRKVPAVYYSTDMFGASLGGLIGGFFLLPVAGIRSTLILLAAIHLAALLLIRIKD